MNEKTPSNGSTAKASEPSIQSIDRAIRILHCFEAKPNLTLSEICSKVGLHKSTVYGILNTLKNNDFLEKDPDTGVYSLGLGLYKLAANVNMDLRRISLPYLQALCNDTTETVNLVVPDGLNVIYVEKCESTSSMHVSTNIGTQLPMYCTAVGKAILAFMEPQMASNILDQTQLIKKTDNTIISKEGLMQSFSEIRKKGYALDMEELEYGLVCVAAPVINSLGQPIAAISCSGPSRRINEATVDSYGDHVTRCALKISSLIG